MFHRVERILRGDMRTVPRKELVWNRGMNEGMQKGRMGERGGREEEWGRKRGREGRREWAGRER